MSEETSFRRFALPAATLAIGLFTGVLAVWGFQQFRSESPPAPVAQSSTTSQDLEQALDKLRQEVAQLSERSVEADLAAMRAEMTRLKQDLAALRSEPVPSVDSGNTALTEELPDSEEPAQTEFAAQESLDQAWAETEAYFAVINDDFVAEAIDSQWRGEAQGLVIDAFAAAEGFENTTLGDIECRATRCRLEVTLETEFAAEEMEAGILDTLGPKMEGMAIHYLRETDDGQPKKAVVYLVRKGHNLSSRSGSE